LVDGDPKKEIGRAAVGAAQIPGRPTSSRKRLLDAGNDLSSPLRGRRPRSHHERGRRIAALTHGDRAAWEGTAIFHELIRLTFEDTPLTALPDILTLVRPDHGGRCATVLAPDWHPDQATEFNGAVWPCLGSAVWALRTTTSFEDAIHAATDLGGDTDTVAAVTGSLAGAYYGLHAIPAQ
jgi:hypothetical protein